jgi:hypothetical protein
MRTQQASSHCFRVYVSVLLLLAATVAAAQNEKQALTLEWIFGLGGTRVHLDYALDRDPADALVSDLEEGSQELCIVRHQGTRDQDLIALKPR